MARIIRARSVEPAGTHGAEHGLERATDEELMTGIGSSDDRCLAELMRRHWHPVVAYAAVLVDPDTAEDIAQETFLRVSAHATRWRPLGPVRAYLVRIARNLAFNERRSRRNRFSVLSAARPDLARRSNPTPTEVLEEHEVRLAITRALDAMPERRRDVFALVRFGGLSYREVADLTATSEQTTANHVSRALADIRRAIEPYVGDAT